LEWIACVCSALTPAGDFNRDSDLDFLLEKGEIRGYFQLGGFYNALVEALGMKVDLVTTGALDDEFVERIAGDEVIIYERQT
jgi:predicted nucleotidyltransferase